MSGKAATQEGGLGNRTVPKPSPRGAMDKISSMIPPPSSNPNETQKNEESDDDW